MFRVAICYAVLNSACGLNPFRMFSLVGDRKAPEGLAAPISYSDMSASEVRQNSQVRGAFGEKIESHAGFFDTDNKTKHMFWWYFPPPEDQPADAPLLIWLQGGPGGSSLFGLFLEMGPFNILKNGTVEYRQFAWTKKYAMLFIDNPVGAGFSYTTGDYCTNTRVCVARNLYELLEQFYAAFPEMRTADLYVTGESYAGHYVPAIAAYIDEQNSKVNETMQMPLKGVAIGDGWVDPINMIGGYPEMMFNQGMLSMKERAIIQDYCDRTLSSLKQGQMTEAFSVWDKMLNGDIWPYHNYFHNITGSNDYDNLMKTNDPPSYFMDYLNRPDIRQQLHLGNATFQSGHDCEMHLLADFMVSFKPEVELLLSKAYKVLIYSGQLDIIIGAALTERFLPLINWEGAAEFASSTKSVWRVTPSDPEVAGYVNSGGGLIYAIVRGAGHMVPSDQAHRAFDMITRFVDGKPFENFPDPQHSAATAILV